MRRKSRVFLDTSALLAGLNSPTGAAGVILAACFSDDVVPIISQQVIDEAERNIARKFPVLDDAWRSFLANSSAGCTQSDDSAGAHCTCSASDKRCAHFSERDRKYVGRARYVGHQTFPASGSRRIGRFPDSHAGSISHSLFAMTDCERGEARRHRKILPRSQRDALWYWGPALRALRLHNAAPLPHRRPRRPEP